jgi:ApbE superfamily uncharacterized protein (UPF0280 family)
MQSRGDRKRIIREATRMRIRAERDYLADFFLAERDYLADFFLVPPGYRLIRRLEEATAITILKPLPNVAGYAAQLGLEVW